MATRTIYLVRHGEYDWDDAPRPRKGLTRRGAQQARLTARRLRTVPATAVYCSDLTRAVETAARISDTLDVPVQSRRVLRECWLPGERPVPRRMRELSLQQADAAFRQFLRPARTRDKHEIIVSHGNLIRYLVWRVLTSTSRPRWRGMRTLNCAISIIVIHADGRLVLVSYNDVGHLPVHLVTQGVPTRTRPTGKV